MPDNYKLRLSYILLMIPLMVLMAPGAAIHAYEGIEAYYIRYDIKSSKNRVVDDNLLMVPAKDDFRVENFSLTFTTGAISAAPGESTTSINRRIKDNSLKTILVNKGLKSVKTKDYDTVISYEGMIITPLKILKNTYNEKQNNYFYKAQVEFSPIAFPDKWETLNMKYKIKKIFHDFFQLFQ
ncbi:MAG: hypothetical protein GXP56_06470 [Deltaproteobacteria bacterium]|nr:hypothetical protein [Deltaproteobacteria bacterium]